MRTCRGSRGVATSGWRCTNIKEEFENVSVQGGGLKSCMIPHCSGKLPASEAEEEEKGMIFGLSNLLFNPASFFEGEQDNVDEQDNQGEQKSPGPIRGDEGRDESNNNGMRESSMLCNKIKLRGDRDRGKKFKLSRILRRGKKIDDGASTAAQYNINTFPFGEINWGKSEIGVADKLELGNDRDLDEMYQDAALCSMKSNHLDNQIPLSRKDAFESHQDDYFTSQRPENSIVASKGSKSFSRKPTPQPTVARNPRAPSRPLCTRDAIMSVLANASSEELFAGPSISYSSSFGEEEEDDEEQYRRRVRFKPRDKRASDYSVYTDTSSGFFSLGSLSAH